MGVISTPIGCPILSITTDLSLLIKKKNLLFLLNPTTPFSMVRHLLVFSHTLDDIPMFQCVKNPVFPSRAVPLTGTYAP